MIHILLAFLSYGMLFLAIVLTAILIHAMKDTDELWNSKRDKVLIYAYTLWWCATILMLKHFG